MGRAPCCDEVGLKKGPWTPEEDEKLVDFIRRHGHGSWRNLPKKAGLNRCGKSCRLRWTNYLRPDIKRGKFSDDEEQIIIQLHSILGNKWSTISKGLPGRTDNEIKNYWNTHLKKKLLLMGIDPVTHRRRTDLDLITSLPSIITAAAAAAATTGNLGRIPLNSALRLQADALHLVRLQLLQTLIQAMSAAATSSSSNSNPTGAIASNDHQVTDDYGLMARLISDCSPDHHDLIPLVCYGSDHIHPACGGAGDQEKFHQQDHESVISPAACPNSRTANSNISSGVVNLTAAAAAAAADYCINSSSSPASTPSILQHAAAGLHDDALYVDSMICWKDIMDQISWTTNSTETYDDDEGGMMRS